jgi:hypothetical protein
VGIVCIAVYLHGAERVCNLEHFYGRRDMNNISEESNWPWWIDALFVIFIVTWIGFGIRGILLLFGVM